MEEKLGVSKVKHFACGPCGRFCFLSKKIKCGPVDQAKTRRLLPCRKLSTKGMNVS